MKTTVTMFKLLAIGIMLLASLIPTIVNTSSSMAESDAVTVFIDSPEIVYKGDSEYFHVLIRISSVTNFYAAQYDIHYLPNVIRVQDVTDGSISDTSISIEAWSFVPVGTQGIVRIINSVPGSSGVSGEGYLADIYFKIVGEPTDGSPLYFIEGMGDPAGELIITNNSGVEISATWISSDVEVGDVEPIPASYPILISPANDATAAGTILQGTSTARVSLMWLEMSGILSFQYQVAYDSGFNNIAASGNIQDTAVYLNLFLGEKYYWRVRAYSPSLSQWSEIWNFTTPLGPASAKPVCISPSSGSTGVSLSPVLQWSSSFDATGYEVVVAKNCDWSNPVINLTGSSALGSGTTYQIPQQLQTNSNYCWKVRSLNAGITSPWSDTATFTTTGTSPTPSTPAPAPSTPPPTPLMCVDWMCPDILIGCCDTNKNGQYDREECSSETAWLIGTGQISWTSACFPTSTPTSDQNPQVTEPAPAPSTPAPTPQSNPLISDIVGQSGGTVETSDGRVSVTFPEGTLSDETEVTISSGQCHSNDGNYHVGDTCFSIEADGFSTGLYGTTICMEYSDYDLSLADGDPGLLTLGYYSGGTWHEADNVYVSGNEICCTTDHLSDWAVLAKQTAKSSIPIAVYIGGTMGAIAVIAILLLSRRAVRVKSQTNSRVKRMKTQMNKWHGEGYDVSDLEDLFK